MHPQGMSPSLPVRILGGASAVLLALGAVGPLAKATLLTAYLGDVSPVRVALLLLIAASALVCAILGRTGWLLVAALLAIGVLGSLALGGGHDTYIPVVSEVAGLIKDVLGKLFTDVAKAIVSLQWGGLCLVGGLLLMLGVGATQRKF
jgi:hypothetical protein